MRGRDIGVLERACARFGDVRRGVERGESLAERGQRGVELGGGGGPRWEKWEGVWLVGLGRRDG